MDEISVLIGGEAGEGINQSGNILAHIFGKLGYYVYVYFEYPSLIRGGHNFSIIRASTKKILSHKERVDFILALNQACVELHKWRLKNHSIILYNSDVVKCEGMPIAVNKIISEEKAPSIMHNSCIIGAFAKACNIEWAILEEVFRKNIRKELEQNLKLARRGYNISEKRTELKSRSQKEFSILTGNESMGLGFIASGLEAYLAYPMTPSSGILHFMAEISPESGLTVFHPENEIAVMLMALGFAYAGKRVAVGTSGGGFCLMTEGLSLAGMAELPIVVVVCQRPGPSTGVPTYTAQGDLNFVLSAGHGEFTRFVVAPGDAEEAFFWAGVSLKISWEFQIPSIILSDKILSERSLSHGISGL